ncbi:DUF2497 domain-containing protein [Altererythrobacter sp. Z27]|uniref:DUF2497 domain-containing protein n=1 Tax=Altererythrobacter sp. Z27 TaxID=3461147 RepID=UPI004044F72F
MAQHGEASVEEILESIKKVIARDNRDAALQAPAPQSLAREVDGGDDDSDILDLTSMEFAQDAVQHAGDEEDDADAPLTTDSVRQSMRENFEALAMLAEPGARPQIVRSGETSLEGMVREMLRPMLAEWLDKNLPGMVEKMVQAEIARIAGKRR